MRTALLILVIALLVPACSSIGQPAPSTQISSTQNTGTQKLGRFPFLEVDVKARQIRVECESIRCENPLEFLLCSTGTNEYEAVLRSKVRPSHLHAALLMLGLKPGEPVHFSEAMNKWLPPHGPPLQISVQFEKEGKSVTMPASRLMRDLPGKRDMPPTTWIFAGSRIMEDDNYAADKTGYLISVVNFDLTVIDIPKLSSNANETLEWGANLDVIPPTGTKVTMIIEPAGAAGAVEAPAGSAAASGASSPPTTAAAIDQTLVTIDAKGKLALNGAPVASAEDLVALLKKQGDSTRQVRVAIANTVEENPAAREVINALSAAEIRFATFPQATAGATTRPADPGAKLEPSDVRVDDEMIRRLRAKWNQSVAPHDASLREAAKTHYDVITQLRREQQRLIDEADKIQRLIDELDKQYQDMTTPRPE